MSAVHDTAVAEVVASEMVVSYSYVAI